MLKVNTRTENLEINKKRSTTIYKNNSQMSSKFKGPSPL